VECRNGTSVIIVPLGSCGDDVGGGCFKFTIVTAVLVLAFV
jgi:hypothetical protein